MKNTIKYLIIILCVILCVGFIYNIVPNSKDDDISDSNNSDNTATCEHGDFGDWKNMGNYHLRSCKECDFTQSFEHTYDAFGKCVSCGAKKSNEDVEAHTCIFDNTVKLDFVSSTCSKKGSYLSPCKVEGCTKTTKTELDLVGHSYNGEIQQYDGTKHAIKCEWCSNVKYQIHDFNEGLITKHATCTAAGIKSYTCKIAGCGYVKQETIQATGHKYANGVCTVCKINCTQHLFSDDYKCSYCGLSCSHNNYTNGICDDCNISCKHKYVDKVTQGTCGVDGIEITVCRTCGFESTVVLSHSFTHDDGISRCDICSYTCPHESHTDGACDVCGYFCDHHSVNSYVTGICGVDGRMVDECLICGYVNSYFLSNHDFNGTSTCVFCRYNCPHESYTGNTCNDCGYVNPNASVPLSD